MTKREPISQVIDLLDPAGNVIHGLSVEAARAIVARGDIDGIGKIDGQFALVGRQGKEVRMARTIGRLMRYFVAKLAEGPALVISDRIDGIYEWLKSAELADQFHPSYTRMVPAHHMVQISLVGCPDPTPTYERFFAPECGTLPVDLDLIGARYIGAVYDVIAKWLRVVPKGEPIGVCFSGGVDSGAVFVLTYHAMLTLGLNPARLKAFTLSVDGQGDDVEQARAFVRALDLEVFLETVDVPPDEIDVEETIRVMEDYKPLDVQAGAMALALFRGVRRRYPAWRYLIDGEGGDENLKDYPIEENPELTIRSVLNNRMLYQEGWGVESIKHSLTYSGGQSRGYARTYAPATTTGFAAFSPFVAPSVIAIAESIPFVALTQWDHQRLYRLKGEIVSRGVRAVTGMNMPIFEKRRFQHGVMAERAFKDRFSSDGNDYRRRFHAIYE
ncbi:MAG: asparagine synthase-related protein [Phycisphaerae bacterium]